MKLTPIIEALVAGAATPEQILRAVRAFEEQQDNALEARRQNDRDRQTRKRERLSREVTGSHSDRHLTGEGARTVDKPLPSENYQQEENKKELRAEFDDVFWPEYPHKVGKPKAWIEFQAARKRADLATITDGLRRYIASKPADRAWLNPATFLHQDRFNDQPAAVVVPMARGSPRRNHLMDRLDELTRPPNDHDPEPSQALVRYVSTPAFGGR